MKALLPYWPILAFVLQLAMVWACASLRQLAKTEVERIVQKSDEKHTKAAQLLDERADAQHDRLTVAEGHIREIRDDIVNLPTKADIERVAGQIEKVAGEVGAVGRGVGRLETFFLQRGVEKV